VTLALTAARDVVACRTQVQLETIKQHFFRFCYDLVTDRKDKDRRKLVDAAEIKFPECFQQEAGTLVVETTWHGPTQVISGKVADVNEATHDGTTHIMDRTMTDLNVRLPVPPAPLPPGPAVPPLPLAPLPPGPVAPPAPPPLDAKQVQQDKIPLSGTSLLGHELGRDPDRRKCLFELVGDGLTIMRAEECAGFRSSDRFRPFDCYLMIVGMFHAYWYTHMAHGLCTRDEVLFKLILC